MKYVYADKTINLPVEYFSRPASVFQDSICVETKELSTEFCPKKAVEYFTAKTRPGKCSKHTDANWKEHEESGGTINF
jgi:hypothetical protein